MLCDYYTKAVRNTASGITRLVPMDSMELRDSMSLGCCDFSPLKEKPGATNLAIPTFGGSLAAVEICVTALLSVVLQFGSGELWAATYNAAG